MARAAEIVAAWSVEDGVRSAGSGEDGGGGCGVVGLVQNNDRTEKRLSQSQPVKSHEFPLNLGGDITKQKLTGITELGTFMVYCKFPQP